MFNKITPQNYNNSLSNSFKHKKARALENLANHNKTIENDIKRFQNLNTKIYKNINTKIYKNIKPYSVYREKIIINHVYQESYAENVKPSGFGDFIRGCYFLLQFCSKNMFQYKIIINHSISLFLKNFDGNSILNNNKEIFNTIPMFRENNWGSSIFDINNYIVNFIRKPEVLQTYINYVSKLKLTNGNVFSYNIMFPYYEINEHDKIYMRNLLEPTEEIKTYLDDTLETIGFHKKSYSIIHIRSGDNYIINNTKLFEGDYFKKIVCELTKLFDSNPNTRYLLIADNNHIKLLLVLIFPSLKYLIKNITHLGEGVLLQTENVKNTLLDFYIMSYSNSIHAFTCYKHGTGFSYWCAKTYNIPYSCMYVPNTNADVS